MLIVFIVVVVVAGFCFLIYGSLVCFINLSSFGEFSSGTG